MLKIMAQFECTVNEKTARFILDQDTPTVVAKEMCFQFQKWIGQIEDSAKAQQDLENPKSEENVESPKE